GLVCDGIIGGVGAVLSFFPQILLLFLFLSILEDSGYMSRAAFIMDRALHSIGLSGKSFVPMIKIGRASCRERVDDVVVAAAADGIRVRNVTGVQTCALPISGLSATVLSAAWALSFRSSLRFCCCSCSSRFWRTAVICRARRLLWTVRSTPSAFLENPLCR